MNSRNLQQSAMLKKQTLVPQEELNVTHINKKREKTREP
jgi:hypothetical protein